MVFASRRGSSASSGLGLPWATSQKLQQRVHTSPMIMKVAVPWPKHSWMFGQLASSQTVTRRFSRNFDSAPAPRCRLGIRTRIQRACAMGPAPRRTRPANADLLVRDLAHARFQRSMIPGCRSRRRRPGDAAGACSWRLSPMPAQGCRQRIRQRFALRCSRTAAPAAPAAPATTSSSADGPPRSFIATFQPLVAAGLMREKRRDSRRRC